MRSEATEGTPPAREEHTVDRKSIDRQSGGARRDRTDDLLLAKQALSQLSYGPLRYQMSVIRYQERHLIPDY
jgi:hypothetical protein